MQEGCVPTPAVPRVLRKVREVLWNVRRPMAAIEPWYKHRTILQVLHMYRAAKINITKLQVSVVLTVCTGWYVPSDPSAKPSVIMALGIYVK